MMLKVEDWGFSSNEDGALVIGGTCAEALAAQFGTPLHVVDEIGLRRRAYGLRNAFETTYPGPFSAYYAMKSNNTPGIVRMILDEGFRPEVGTAYEWCLAQHLGVEPSRIMVNGPHKGDLLRTAIVEGAGLIVVDGPHELDLIEKICGEFDTSARILIRVNPNAVPKGMNRASATGSRKLSVFGFDVASGEVTEALKRIAGSDPLEILVSIAAEAERYGLKVDTLDIGGGYGVPTSRELDTLEFLLYQGIGRLPRSPDPNEFPSILEFADQVSRTIADGCQHKGLELPQLVVEPGRAIVSGAGVLLLGVGAVKRRDGVGTWVITDGAAGTVAFPLYYEYHEVLLCRAVHAPRTERYTLVGPVCFSADWIYRNKRMPPIKPGDVLAVCDAGAYFTVQETNFGFPRPPIVSVKEATATLLRRRETFDDMVSRDIGWGDGHAT
jgi:diaminopimelate decarboxylase